MRFCKYFTYCIFCLFILSCSLKNDYNKKSEKNERKECFQIADFVKVNKTVCSRSGAKWSVYIEFINMGSEYMAISSVISSCSCIKTNYGKKPMKHLGKSYLKITYTPNNSEEYYFQKTVMVLFNDGKYYKMIRLSY